VSNDNFFSLTKHSKMHSDAAKKTDLLKEHRNNLKVLLTGNCTIYFAFI